MAEAVAKERALDATVNVVRVQHKKGHAILDHGEESPAGIRPDQLPLCDFTEGGSEVRHAVDIISEHVGEAPKDDIRECLGRQNPAYGELPEPFRLKDTGGVSYHMSIFAIPLEGGKFAAVKVIEMAEKQEKGFLKGLCVGTPQMISWGEIGGSNAHHNLKAFQCMIEGLGGFQARALGLAPSSKEGGELDEDAIEAGFDYIYDEGPRHTEKLTQLKWIAKRTRKQANCPIAGWRDGLAKEALRQLAQADAFAAAQTFFGMTMADYEMYMVDLGARLVASRKLKGNLCLGKAGIGKSPYIKSLTMRLSHQARIDATGRTEEALNGSYRVCSEMDLFRGRPGLVDTPDIFDDGDSSTRRPRVLKAFGDIASAEAGAVARWTGRRRAKGQPRALLGNKYDQRVEPGPQGAPSSKNGAETITHEQLMSLIRPAWPIDMLFPDQVAVLKRINFVVQTDLWLYIRFATEDEVPAHKFPVPEKRTWIRKTSGPKFGAILEGAAGVPDGHKPIGPTWTRSDAPLDVSQAAEAFNDKQRVTEFLRDEHREASPDPFADGFRCDRRGADSDDCEGDEDDDPLRGTLSQELERLRGLHLAGAIALVEFNSLKKSAIGELAPAKKEKGNAKQERARRTPIKKVPAGATIKGEPAGAPASAGGVTASPVDKETMKAIFPGVVAIDSDSD
ncbi:unnamed protein product [Prorocentrum cordatum]|uniref:Uncharacterized protein n=1 Tax=Prorocentrum cordatum TaxID=2364126 RepID=A0ABN9Q0I1_9DINO|nr:unnamed protein product [Polarella glacialis]